MDVPRRVRDFPLVSRRLRDLPLLCIVVVAAVLRLYDLGAESLWTDELLTLEFVTPWSGFELLVNLPQAQPHLPLYYLVLDAWIAVAGTSEVALRFPSAVFGIVAVPVIYAVGARLLDREAGLFAALLLAVSPFHVEYAQEVRMYSLLVLLALVSVYFLLRVRAEPTRWNAAGFAVATVLLIYTHVFAVFVLAAEALYVAVRLYRTDDRLRPWATAFAPVAVAAMPLFAIALYKLTVGGGISYEYVPPPTLGRVVTMISTYVGYGHGTTALVHGVVVPLFGGLALGALVRVRLEGFEPRRPVQSLRSGLDLRPASVDESVLLVALFALPFFLPLVFSYVVTPLFWPRYTIAASLGLFLLVARGLRHLESRHLRYAMAGLLVLSMLPSLGLYYTETQKEEWREVGATIDERSEAGDLVLVADQITEPGVHHYTDRESLRIKGVVLEASGTGYAAADDETVREMQRGEDRIWLVLAHGDESEYDRVRSIVAENRTETFHRQYVGVEVYRYEREGAS